jgi:hypothetical protein
MVFRHDPHRLSYCCSRSHYDCAAGGSFNVHNGPRLCTRSILLVDEFFHLCQNLSPVSTLELVLEMLQGQANHITVVEF